MNVRVENPSKSEFSAMIILGNSRRSLPWKTYSSNKPYNNPLNFVMDSALMESTMSM